MERAETHLGKVGDVHLVGNWAVAKYGIKRPKSDPLLRRRGIVTYVVASTPVTISSILPSLSPGHDGYRAGLLRAPERAHAVDGLKRGSLGRPVPFNQHQRPFAL
jgi:hypothetical protein